MNNAGLGKCLVMVCGLLCLPNTVAEEPATATGTASVVQDTAIRLQTTAVKGSRELPKVLVIVPWKTAAAPGLGGRPLASLVEEALTPLDPAVFRRRLHYYTELKATAATPAQPAAEAQTTL